jgi:hypothetical protein
MEESVVVGGKFNVEFTESLRDWVVGRGMGLNM